MKVFSLILACLLVSGAFSQNACNSASNPVLQCIVCDGSAATECAAGACLYYVKSSNDCVAATNSDLSASSASGCIIEHSTGTKCKTVKTGKGISDTGTAVDLNALHTSGTPTADLGFTPIACDGTSQGTNWKNKCKTCVFVGRPIAQAALTCIYCLTGYTLNPIEVGCFIGSSAFSNSAIGAATKGAGLAATACTGSPTGCSLCDLEDASKCIACTANTEGVGSSARTACAAGATLVQAASTCATATADVNAQTNLGSTEVKKCMPWNTNVPYICNAGYGIQKDADDQFTCVAHASLTNAASCPSAITNCDTCATSTATPNSLCTTCSTGYVFDYYGGNCFKETADNNTTTSAYAKSTYTIAAIFMVALLSIFA